MPDARSPGFLDPKRWSLYSLLSSSLGSTTDQNQSVAAQKSDLKMVRAYIFVLLQACFCFYIFSNGRHLAVASEIRSEKSNKCADASSCGEPTIHEEAKDKTVSSPWAFIQAFSKLGISWNHVIGEYIALVKGAEGLELKGDVHVQDMENG